MSVKIALLITGDEILSGDTLDTNSNFFCSQISQLGLRVDRIVTCGDNKVALASIIEHLIKDFDVLIINGGLGPTEDDYTHEVLALVTGKKLTLNNQAKKYITDWLEKKGYQLGPANLKQAYFPAGSTIIVNNKGTAPGAMLKYKNSLVFTTPGVPFETYEMWHNFIKDKLIDVAKLSLSTTVELRSFGIGESVIQDVFTSFQIKTTDHIKIGFRAHFPYVDCKITFNNQLLNDAKLEKTTSTMKKILTDYLVSPSKVNLENLVVDQLIRLNKKVSLVESVTGGMLASLFTRVPGASKVLEYALVTYSNSSKSNLLNIKEDLITKYGAVSEFTILSMLDGILKISQADYAIATSGLAGSLLNNEDVLPGTVFIAWKAKGSKGICHKFQFFPDRLRTISLASFIALDGLRRLLSDLPMDMLYSFDINSDKALLAKKLSGGKLNNVQN